MDAAVPALPVTLDAPAPVVIDAPVATDAPATVVLGAPTPLDGPAPIAVDGPAPTTTSIPIVATDVAPVAQPVAAIAAAVAAAVVATEAPLTRRARRATTVPTPVAAEPAPAELPEIAPVELSDIDPAVLPEAPVEDASAADAASAESPATEPAPLLDTVLTPAEPFELLEPEVGPHIDLPHDAEGDAVEPDADADASASDVDEFEAAARLFAFTGETPVVESPVDEPAPEVTAHHAVRGSRASHATSLKRVTAVSFSVGVMGIVGLLTVGMTTPAEAVAAASGEDVVSVYAPGDVSDVYQSSSEQIQAYVTPASVQNVAVVRDERYSTVSMAQLASEAGIRNFSNLFTNDPNSNIQWPFTVGVSMTDGFGMRDGGMHEGIDFTPGEGSPIQAIADGTVRIATESGGAFGVTVLIDHIIDGQLVSSRYGHMQYGSLQVQQGQHVSVGTVIGSTGNTGRSYGAHLHFEILQNGTTAIDPWPWLQTYTDGTHAVG